MMWEVFIEDIKLRHRHQAHIVSCVLEKKKSLLTDIGTQRRAPNLVNKILWVFGQQGPGYEIGE